MPTGKPGTGRQALPQPFQVRYDADRRQWAVRQGERWRFTRDLCLQVNTLTIDDALTGVGVVHALARGNLVITS